MVTVVHVNIVELMVAGLTFTTEPVMITEVMVALFVQGFMMAGLKLMMMMSFVVMNVAMLVRMVFQYKSMIVVLLRFRMKDLK